jgi:hypothetical protein
MLVLLQGADAGRTGAALRPATGTRGDAGAPELGRPLNAAPALEAAELKAKRATPERT